jgi:hypothetical protein
MKFNPGPHYPPFKRTGVLGNKRAVLQAFEGDVVSDDGMPNQTGRKLSEFCNMAGAAGSSFWESRGRASLKNA